MTKPNLRATLDPQFDGTTVTMQRKEYLLPPLTLNQLRKMTPKLGKLGNSGIPTNSDMDVMLEVIHMSAVRNYPTMTRDDLGDLVDLGNLQTVFAAVMSVSGLDQKTGEV